MLGVCVVSHNRVEYTRRTIESLRAGAVAEPVVVLVDSGSTEDISSLAGLADVIVRNGENIYPGAATLQGWGLLRGWSPSVKFLCRVDNDMEFAPGWDATALEYFELFPKLGQLGIDHNVVNDFPGIPGRVRTVAGRSLVRWPSTLGGPCIVPVEVWDRGVRPMPVRWCDRAPLDHMGMPTQQEDVRFSLAVQRAGYDWGAVGDRIGWSFATPDTWGDYPDYYRRTMRERGYIQTSPEIRAAVDACA